VRVIDQTSRLGHAPALRVIPPAALGDAKDPDEYVRLHGASRFGGLVRDAEILYRSWAFDVSTIERPVHMWQGTDDLLVPAVINKQVADRMPGSVWHSVEGAGHFVAVGSGDDVLAIAADELGA